MKNVELRAVRASLGVSQKRMAAEIGRSLRQYKAYESGEYAIPQVVALTVQGLSIGPDTAHQQTP